MTLALNGYRYLQTRDGIDSIYSDFVGDFSHQVQALARLTMMSLLLVGLDLGITLVQHCQKQVKTLLNH
jgi:hypothetical protein